MNMDHNTYLLSTALVNREVWAIRGIEAIVDIVKGCDGGILLHIDTYDAFGRIRLNLKELNIDLASFSNHKVYGLNPVATFATPTPRFLFGGVNG